VCAALALAAAPAVAGADDLMRIAAVVNDDVISVFDLESRVAMAIFSSNLPDTPEMHQRIAGPVLRNLIDEALQVQEANRQGIRVGDADIAAALAEIERNNGVEPGGLAGFLDRIGIATSALERQVRAQIAWGKFLNQRVRPTIDIGEEEIDEEIARLEASRGRPEYLVSEIDLYLDPQTTESDLLTTASQLVEQLRAGADFAAVAAQFSQGSMAREGGDLGWIPEGRSRPQIEQALREMSIGEVSAPIRSIEGVHILYLRDKRAAMERGVRDIEVYLTQILLPRNDGEPPPEHLALAREIGATVSGCEAMRERAGELDSSLSGDIGWVKLADLPGAFRAAVAEIEVGRASAPITTDAGVHVLMACERKEPAPETDVRDVIYDRIAAQRLTILERRLLRDLRRNAFVDLRV
jgi:peptidyl-prolyl cis-trans isomerase SurA